MGETTQDIKVEKVKLGLEYQKRCCQKRYYDFFLAAWEVLEPVNDLKLNWHIEYLCHRLQREIERLGRKEKKDKDIIINISPRSLKSYIVSIMLCPWAWTKYPHLKFISASHSRELSIEHCRKSRQLIDSEWYQRFWHNAFGLTGDQNVKSFYENNKSGVRYAASIAGGVTGHGADVIVADDLIDPLEALSEVALEKANIFYSRTLSTRLNDQETGLRIVVMQRLHEDDVTGHELEKKPDKYEHFCIPAELEGADVSPLEIAKYYKEGLFFPKRFTRDVLNEMKSNGSRFYAGQFLQRPSEKEGDLYKRSNWRFYKILPPKFDIVFQSWDATFKKTKKGSFVVGQVWGKIGIYFYLIDQFRKRIGFLETLREIAKLSLKYPEARKKLIEDKANGPAIMSVFEKKVEGLVAVEPKGDKLTRATAMSYLQEAGNIYLPDPSICTWIEEYIDEFTRCPNEPNDQVDASTQAWSEMGGSDAIERLKQFLSGF
ncbi:MAG: hypothetical protein COS89_03405 [Deltaproteobacteria bacterium CG07_land_8_20_14_0_80_38_7]|nr:MAG: hypothetical protein COS89_03405 [Deltaproteobacteria bacterium CG07_land_8_20_14_0_80_38_7]